MALSVTVVYIFAASIGNSSNTLGKWETTEIKI